MHDGSDASRGGARSRWGEPIYWNGGEIATAQRGAMRVGEPAPRIRFMSRSWGTQIVLHDLLNDGFLLLAGPSGNAWCTAARELALLHGIGLVAHAIGGEGDLVVLDAESESLLDMAPGGALLLDRRGIVIWRSQGVHAHHRELLERAMR